MCRCPGILVISWIRPLRSGCLQPAEVRPWSSLLPVAGASVPLRFLFSADCSSIVCDRSSYFSFLPSEASLSLRFLFSVDRSSIVCDRSSCFSFLPSEVSLSLRSLISADRLSFVCSVQVATPPCRSRPFGCGASLFRLRILFLSRIVHVPMTVGRRLRVVEGIVPLPPSHCLQLVPLTFDPSRSLHLSWVFMTGGDASIDQPLSCGPDR